MPKSYDLITQIVDEMAPLPAGQESVTVMTMRSIIREALRRYENACMEEAVFRGER